MKMLPYIVLFLGAAFSACGLLSGDRGNALFRVTPISAVEVALEISAGKGDRITIARDGAEIFSFRLNRSDTVIYDDGLQPSTSYIWEARHSSARGRGRSVERQATTLDTTSSTFTWQTFSFGEHSSSVLYGVSIIDESNIWAVGEIFMNDSTNQIYNAAHWDGENWELVRVPFEGCGILYPRIRAVISLSETNAWFARGGVTHYNGTNYTTDCSMNELLDGSINKLFGGSSQDLYAVGGLGTIIYYNGQNWQKIETGTDLDVYDIHGNEKQGVVAVAAKYLINFDKVIVQINDKRQASPLIADGIPYPISGIWFDKTGVAYIVGSGMYRKPDIHSSVAWQPFHEGITNNYLQAIDAGGLNDIVVAGAFGEILHFNGAVWASHNQAIDGNMYDIDLKEDIAAAVGYHGRKAFITIGRRE